MMHRNKPLTSRSTPNRFLIPTFLWTTLSLLSITNAMTSSSSGYFIGFDFGTSGARISVINRNNDRAIEIDNEVHSDSIVWQKSCDDADEWINAMHLLLSRVPTEMLRDTKAICASGTSASCVLVEKATGKVSRKPRMYDYDVGNSSFGLNAMDRLGKYAPSRHTAKARTSSLAKLISWHEEEHLYENDDGTNDNAEVLVHQADFLAMHLMSHGTSRKNYEVVSDWHNCLKLGYDVRKLEWPSWLKTCLSEAGISLNVLPSKVVSPGMPIGTISPSLASRYDISKDAQIIAGTTDSNAAFFAAAGTCPTFGVAVTSLGSTLAMKVLSKSFCEDADLGVYSHRFPAFTEEHEVGEAWLIGGASNTGCGVLRQVGFSNDELQYLSMEIDPTEVSPLEYYPLTKKGERFPIADSEKLPILEPVPASRKDFLHGILQAITNIEVKGFSVLGKLGASPALPTLVLTCGGGSNNDMWLQMRENRLNILTQRSENATERVKVRKAENTEASYGAAILAAATF